MNVLNVNEMLKESNIIEAYESVDWDYFKNLHFSCYHNHSDYSNLRLLDSVIKVEELIDEAIKLGHKAVAITDHESISGHVRAVKYIKKLRQKKKKAIEEADKLELEIDLKKFIPDDFQLVLGNEIYLINNLETIREDKKEGIQDYYHFILLAKDEKGYKQLRALSAQAWLNMFKTGNMDRVPIEKRQLEKIIGDEKGHLIATTACLGGEMARLTMKQKEEPSIKNKKELMKFINWNISQFGKSNFFVELQPRKSSIDQRDYNREALRIAKACKLNWVFATDSHYHNERYKKVHEIILRSKDGDRELESFYETTYMMEKEELIYLMSLDLNKEDVKQGLINSEKIRKKIDSIDMKHDVVVPEIPLTEEQAESKHKFLMWYDNYEFIKKFAYSESKQDRFLLRKIEEGMEDKNQPINEKTLGRINEELETLWIISDNMKQRLSSYYVLTRDTILEVLWKDDMGSSLVGIARGSVTGCYFAYLVDITQMNPLDWDLPFWRHLHVSRPELPKPI